MNENEKVKHVIITNEGERIVREFSFNELKKMLIPNPKIREQIIEKMKKGEKFPFELENGLDDEVFKKYPQNPKYACSSFGFRRFLEQHPADLDIWVSNYGRVKKNNVTLLKPYLVSPNDPNKPDCPSKDDLWYVNVSGSQKYHIYRLVAETWLECPFEDSTGWVVHHITNDGYDNTPNNLIWVTKEQHTGKIH
jgi:hypothetical protein